MAETLGSNGNDLTITIPSALERDWATSIRQNCFQKIVDHDHSGSGKGKKLAAKDSLDLVLNALVANDIYLKADNAAGSGFVNLLRATSGDEIEFGATIASADFQSDGATISDASDNTKKLDFDVSGVSTSTTRTLTVPDADVDLGNLTNSNISSSAAIALSKLAGVTANRALVSGGAGKVTASSVTATELGYLGGVTSSIQTQLGTKVSTGTSNEIVVSGTQAGLADNPVLPGTGSTTVPKGTTAQRSGTPASGMFRYNTDTNQFEGYDGSAWGEIGGGGGGENFIDNSDFEANADGWAVGSDTSDYDGGSASVTFARNTSSPLQDAGDGLFTKDAADRSDEFFKTNVTIPSASHYQVVTLSFDYKVSSGYEDDDLKIVFYDVTNSEILTVTSGDVIKASSVVGKHYAQVQLKNTASLRIAFVVNNTDTNAYTMNIDNVRFGRLAVSKGAAITDWEEFTPTITNLSIGNGTITGRYRRVGDSASIQYYVNFGSTTSISGNIALDPPLGLNFDSSKRATWMENSNVELLDASNGANRQVGTIRFSGTTLDVLTEDLGAVNATTPFTWTSGDTLAVTVFEVPITGWSSNTKQSTDFGNRVIAAHYRFNSTGNGNPSLANNVTEIVDFNDKLFDTVDMVTTGSGWQAEIPESGYYSIFGSCSCNGAENLISSRAVLLVYIDGVSEQNLGVSEGTTGGYPLFSPNGSVLLYLEKGKTIDLRMNQNSGATETIVAGDISIHKIQSPETLLGSEKVFVEANRGSNLSIGNATYVDVPFDSKSSDTHNAFDTTTGEFTAPETRTYDFSASWLTQSVSWSSTDFAEIRIEVSGSRSISRTIGVKKAQTSFTSDFVITGSTSLELQKGDIAKVQVYQTSGGAINLIDNDQYTWLSIRG